jgi:hypothetical protein
VPPGSPLGTALDVLREKRRLSEASRVLSVWLAEWLCIVGPQLSGRRLSCWRFAPMIGFLTPRHTGLG